MANSAEYANLNSLADFIKYGSSRKENNKGPALFTGELYRSEAYDDGYGNPTIGFGRIYNEDGSRVKMGDKVKSREEEARLFNLDLIKRRDNIINLSNKHNLNFNNNQIDALTSFSFNAGENNLKNLIFGDKQSGKTFEDNDPRSLEDISKTLLIYNKAKNKDTGVKELSPGVLKRRFAEYDLFTGGLGNRISTDYALNFLKNLKGSDAEVINANLEQLNNIKSFYTDTPREFSFTGQLGTQQNVPIESNNSNPPDVSNFVNFIPSMPTQSMSDQSNNILANMIPEIVSSGASPATFIPGQIANPMSMDSMVPPEFNKEPGAVEQIKNSIMSRFNRTMRGYDEYSDGTPEVPAFYADFGSDFGPTHMQYLEKAIEGLRKRFPDASNEQIVNAIPDSIITDIRAQVKFDQDKAGKANTLVDPYETDTVPAMLTPGEAVIPAEAAQLKRNRAEIERMVREGREIQDRKEELNINPLDQSQNEKLAEKETSYLGILPPDHPLNKGFDQKPPRLPQQYINDGSDINILQPGRTSYLGILPPDSPVGEPPRPQQYINDASNVNIEQQLSMIPEDPRVDNIDNDAAIKKSEELIKANQEGKPSVPAGVDTSGIMGFFNKIGFTEQDIYRALLYYVGGRLTGGSHAGSLRWAGKQVLTEQSTRAKTAASAGSQALTYYRMRGEQMLKDGSLTIKGRRALTDALNKGNVQAIVSVMNDKENYSAIGQLADLSKPTEVFSKTGYMGNTTIVFPGYDGNYYKQLEDGTVVKVNPDDVRKFSADIEDNINNFVATNYAGDTEKKLKAVFGINNKGDFSKRLRSVAKKFNKPSGEVTTAMENILSLIPMPEKGKESEVRRSMEAALELTVLSPNKQVDVTKLANVNQSNINEMVKDFGGPEITTQILQNVDTELGGENITAATIDINRQEEEIKASGLTDAEKATIAKQPNPYFKGLYLHYFKNKDKYKAS